MVRSFGNSNSHMLRDVGCPAYVINEVGGRATASVKQGYDKAYEWFHFYTQIP